MRKLTMLTVFLSLAFLPPAFGQGKKGNPKVLLQPTTPGDYTALSKMPQVFGKLVSFDPVGGTLILEAEYQAPDPGAQVKAPVNNPPRPKPILPIMVNPFKPANQQAKDAMKQYRNKMIKLQQQQIQQYKYIMRQQMNNQQGNPAGVKMLTMAKEFQLSIAKDPQVARYTLSGEYDEKGNFKEPTAEDLKKLKHPKLPGYTAKLTEVLPGQQVNLYLGKADPKKQAANIDLLKNNPLAPAAPPANAPMVEGILIVTDVDLSSLPAPKKKKNK